MTLSLTKETGNASAASSHWACSNGRYRKDKCGNGEIPTARDRVSSEEPIHYECGQKEK